MFFYFRWKDPRRTVIALNSVESKINLDFLKAAAALMEEWPKNNIPANQMFSQDTRKAVLLTSRNMAEAVVDILQKYQDRGIGYICSGKLYNIGQGRARFRSAAPDGWDQLLHG